MKLMLVEEDVAPELVEDGPFLQVFDHKARMELVRVRAHGFTIGQRHIIEDGGKTHIVWDVLPPS